MNLNNLEDYELGSLTPDIIKLNMPTSMCFTSYIIQVHHYL